MVDIIPSMLVFKGAEMSDTDINRLDYKNV